MEKQQKKKVGEAKGGGHIATLAALNQFIDWRGVDAEDRAKFTAYLVRLLPAIRADVRWLFKTYTTQNAIKILAKAMVLLAEKFPEEERLDMWWIFTTAAFLIMHENPPGMIPVEELKRLRATLWENVPEFRYQPDPVTPTGQTAFYSMFAGTA